MPAQALSVRVEQTANACLARPLGQCVLARADQPRRAAPQPDPFGDLTTELERELGRLVKAKHHTDFYVLYRYPLAVAPRPRLLLGARLRLKSRPCCTCLEVESVR